MGILDTLNFAKGMARSSDIRRWKKYLLSQQDVLIQAVARDTGRTVEECYLMEWAAVENALNFLEDSIEDAVGPKPLKSSFRTLLGNRTLYQRRVPLGQVLIVGTWNYPMALHLTQILFARAAGNRVVLKSSPMAAHLGEALGKVLSGLWSKDEFRVWNPAQPEEVLEAIRNRDFQLVVFTGGTSAARIFAKACGEAMIPFIPEASGSEAAIVVGKRRESEVKQDVDHLLWAVYHQSGQTCVAPRFWFVPRALSHSYFEKAQEIIDQSAPTSKSRMPLKNPGVEKEHAGWKAWVEKQNCESQYQSTERPEFSVYLLGGAAALSSDSPPTFGPAAAIVPYDSLSQVVEWVRRSPWSLMTAVLGQAHDSEARELEGLDASVISINEAVMSVGDAAIPFGGRGLSGYGVTHGVEGLNQMSRSQTWVEVHSWPGLGGLRPSWRSILKLNKASVWLKEVDASPVKAAKKFVRKIFGSSDAQTS